MSSNAATGIQTSWMIALVTNPANPRLYGGIHYRFDDDEGLALGRVVARYAVERERRGALNAWRAARGEVKR